MSEVTLSGISKNYRGVVAVRETSLAIRQGELIALLGPSGCGKTTTLRMIAGFIPPSTGTIRIGQKDVTRLPPYLRDTGMVFQGYALFPHMTVAENVAFGLEMRKVAPADRSLRVRDALAMVRLDHLAARYPRELSGGQQQRVALARAIVIKPDVLLLDEPLSNLDAKLRHDVRIEIRRLQQELGLTTVFVTHDQEEALAIADRLVVMNQGEIAQIGTAHDLYDAPRTSFVANFMGTSNFFAGDVEQPGIFRTKSGLRLAFTGDAPAGARILTLRPERISLLADAAETNGANRMSGHAKIVTFLGPVMEVSLALDAGDDIKVHLPAALHASIAEGDRLDVECPAAACRIVDDSSEPATIPVS